MTRFLSFAFALATISVIACGGDSTGCPSCADGGTDVTINQDSSPTDAPADTVTKSDSGLKSGDVCDLQNDQCPAGLKCCTEPTHIPDASTHDICAPIQDGGACPMYP